MITDIRYSKRLCLSPVSANIRACNPVWGENPIWRISSSRFLARNIGRRYIPPSPHAKSPVLLGQMRNTETFTLKNSC
jgi:hypothetical protein